MGRKLLGGGGAGLRCSLSDLVRARTLGLAVNPGQCGYTFAWRTSAACPQTDSTVPTVPTPTSCETIDVPNGLRYDLTALAKATGNWLVQAGEYLYAINVCEAVHGLSLCGDSAGACQLKPSNTSFAKVLGHAATAPELSQGSLVMRFLNGDKCHGTYDRSTVIFFQCDPFGKMGKPTFLQETDDCEYVFEWTTAAACPEKLASPCQLEVGSTTYDLSKLHRSNSAGVTNWRVSHPLLHEDVEHEMAINVCGGLVTSDNPCREGVAVCEWNADAPAVSRSLGSVPVLVPTPNGVVATFTDGDVCESGARVTTMVNYICDTSAGQGSPVYACGRRQRGPGVTVVGWGVPYGPRSRGSPREGTFTARGTASLRRSATAST